MCSAHACSVNARCVTTHSLLTWVNSYPINPHFARLDCHHQLPDSLTARPHPLTRKRSGSYWAICWLHRVSSLDFWTSQWNSALTQVCKINVQNQYLAQPRNCSTVTRPISSWEGGFSARDCQVAGESIWWT